MSKPTIETSHEIESCGPKGVKMIGSFITRGLVLILGYAFPAYECFKTVEMNRPDIEQLRFWCQYWILVAGLTVGERIGDMFIGWVPMYGEAKLAFFIYLWFPKTKGTIYVYDSFFKPYVAKHETEIDRSLLELRIRAADMALLYWQKGASYFQTRVFDILQYIASKSTPARPAQPQQQNNRAQKPTAPSNHRSAATPQPQKEQPSSPVSSSTSSREDQKETKEETGPSEEPKPAPALATSNEQKTTPEHAVIESSKSLSSIKEQLMLIDSVPAPSNESARPTLQDLILGDPGRVTRARSRSRLGRTRTR
ncbi:hypothetical protein BUALT_Bualt01G0025800 [Buddleja alternifolia]|uniref:HVA22-like protein n=1 Tax=Buddleja alternifolia TaxID=168488 RepID=A0AAV6Y519_9LAMI|nr:hypothetical protein BUALT_Bualt01G0025800 [Buddleja alternifolia]